jgi:predicted dehydrogenase
MTRRLKVGLLGAGIGRLHVGAYRTLPDLFSVAAIADIDGARAAALAGEAGAQAVEGLDQLLALNVDIVDICTPSALHFDHACQVMAAGRHAIVEKPVAPSLAEVDRLIDAARASGRKLAPIFQYRFGNGLGRLRHLIATGVAGKPYVATAETHWRRTQAYFRDTPWRGTWEGALGGCLATHAIHAHDLLTLVLGRPRLVFARTATRVNDIEVEDCAVVAMETEGGALATSSITLGSEEEISRLRFCFEGLTAESSLSPYTPAAMPWRFVARDEGQARRIEQALADFPDAAEGFAGQFAAIHAAIVDGSALPVTLEDARVSLELLSAAYHSARSGEAVSLPLDGEHPAFAGWLPSEGPHRR